MSYIIKTNEQYQADYKNSVDNPEAFWATHAKKFTWQQKWDKVLEWDFVSAEVKWFLNGKLNITENALDRHVAKHPNKAAIIWEANDPNDAGTTLTYRELYEQVCQFANVLKSNGVEKGDRVCIYMPMVPEAAVAMLACARVGAIHSVVFGGFSAQSLADRINDSACKVLLTSESNSKTLPTKPWR
jgi:acetyl-CoA synthetase